MPLTWPLIETTLGSVVASFGLDISGYLTSDEFFGLLAGLFGGILIAVFNALTAGWFGVS
jgi:hypothetical protein